MVTKAVAEVMAASRMMNVRYAIRDLAVAAEEVAREGHQILYLNIGDPCKFDFHTPPHMIEAVLKAMVDGHNGYAESLGIKPAVEAIRNQAESNGFSEIQSIFIGIGSGEVIDTCLTALLNPGDNVLTPSPEYPLYGAIMAKLDCPANPYELDEDNGWEPDVDDIARKINSRTRAILLITPNNPTGAVYSKRTLEKILELARRHNLIIFADEIYDKLIFDPKEKHISIATLATDVPMVTFNGLSKAYLVPGWRIGWAIATGPRRVVRPYMEAVHRLLRARLSAPHPFQHAIKPALEGPQDHLEEVLRKLKRRADLTVQWAKRTPHVKLVAPKGAFYAHPSLEIPEDDLTFVTDLLKQKHVLVVHGSGFGEKPGTRHMRIVFLPPEPVLSEAYDKITEFMRERYQ
ncbi:MAG TPA: aminotransferase class I/II-fold pyridoxal phosphate-dependent enzyme [Terriglobales bacterium]|jgi:alanine-synthesizing transaminase|nr:aminotransferase class I/II-fold pyridoxal phosphate-dependent enzyme [Terriglobales bacterium]